MLRSVSDPSLRGVDHRSSRTPAQSQTSTFHRQGFMDPPRLRSNPLGSGDSSDFQPNQRECHRACGEGTWLRWFLFGGSERRRCSSQCWCSLSQRNEQVSGGHFVCPVAQTVECICHCLTLMTSGHRAADLRAWLLPRNRRLDRRMDQ